MKGVLLMNEKYKKTVYACFIGYIVQAIVNNFVPLLFLTFESTYQIPLGQITMLITINFGIQLLVDLLSTGFVDKIGYRASIMIAHIFFGGRVAWACHSSGNTSKCIHRTVDFRCNICAWRRFD